MSVDRTDELDRTADTRTIVDGLPASLRSTPIERGSTIGRYLVIDTLGEGGMGVVVRAYDPKLYREVALKRLHRDVLDSDAEARLLREAQAMAQLNHPNVITIYDVERTDDGVVMAMELVEGPTLAEWITQGPHPWSEVLERFVQAGEGLAAAHRAGLVHRDFKPGNAMIDPDGRVKVMDFGLARAESGPEPIGSSRITEAEEDGPIDVTTTGSGSKPAARVDVDRSGSLSMQLTQVGAVMGTPAYMAPEQHRGEVADARSDQYAFCVSLWEALWERPFRGDFRAVVLAKHEGPPTPTKTGGVPRAIQEALRRGLAAKAGQRWPSMTSLLEVLEHDPREGRRRWWWVGGVVGVTATVAGTLALGRAEGASPCADAAGQLVGTWDDDARAEVHEALRGTGLSYAEATWERVAEHLDGYGEQWAQMYVEACEATAVRKVQSEALLDRRMQCLRRRRLRMGAAVEVLAGADAAVAETAIQQVTSLPPLERCADVDALMAELPPPEHPQVAAAVEEIRDELTTAQALAKAGRYDDSQQQIEALLERAHPLEHDPLEAELLALSAMVADHQGRFELAEQRGTEAYELALRSGATETASQAALSLMFTTGSQQARPEVGRAWGISARALAERAEPDGSQPAMVLNAMGVIAYREGDFAAAIDHFEQALPVLIETLGEDHDRVATNLNHLGVMLDEQGRYTEAERHFRRALVIQTEVFGEGHPQTTMSIDNLALCLQVQGRNEEAKQLHERTLGIRIEALGAEHPNTAMAHNNLGWDHMGLGEPEIAAEHFAEGLAGFEAALGPEHPRVAMAAESLALAQLDRGRFAESEALLQRSLEIRRSALGEDHPNVALSLAGLGRAAMKQERYDEAIELQQQALAIIEAKSEGAERYLADVLMELGASLVEAERFEEARPVLERALALREEGGVSPVVLGQIRFDLARAVAGQGDASTAREHATAAREELAQAEGESAAKALAEVDGWLAAAGEAQDEG